jgi:hypothetical protein
MEAGLTPHLDHVCALDARMLCILFSHPDLTYLQLVAQIHPTDTIHAHRDNHRVLNKMCIITWVVQDAELKQEEGITNMFNLEALGHALNHVPAKVTGPDAHLLNLWPETTDDVHRLDDQAKGIWLQFIVDLMLKSPNLCRGPSFMKIPKNK